MKLRTNFVLAGLALGLSSALPVAAAERSPYDSNPDCMRRDANAADCTVDNGPPRRRNSAPPPAPQNPQAPQPAPQPSDVKR